MISKFLIKCSGADKDILNECPESEKTKFVGIGATIFLTSILAGISGGYAIFFTFNNLFVSFVFGLLWTLLIFNLDRYIVSSIRKQGNLRKELYVSIPRIAIAVLLAITISKPLELKLFDGSVSKKMGEIEDQYNSTCENNFKKQITDLRITQKNLQQEINTSKTSTIVNDPIVKEIKNQIGVFGFEANSLNTLINQNKYIINQNTSFQDISLKDGKFKRVRKYNKVALQKISDNNGFVSEIKARDAKIINLNDSISKRKEVLSNQIQVIEKQYSLQVSSIQNQINELNNNRSSIIEKCRFDSAQEKDILARLKALAKLKNEDTTAYLAGLLITLLFVLIETSPIIVKLMSKVGAYDKMFDRVEEEFFLKQEIILEKKHDVIRNYIAEFKELNKIRNDLRSDSERLRAESELKALEQIHSEILKKQVVISKQRVNDWFKSELDDLNIKVNVYLSELKTAKEVVSKYKKDKYSPKKKVVKPVKTRNKKM